MDKILQRFLAKQVVTLDAGCWEWRGSHSRDGYALFWYDGAMNGAHRFVYELFRGPLIGKDEPDHLCRNPGCLRPSHLEAVTHRVNTLRGNTIVAAFANRESCKYGHSFQLHGIPRADGGRRCKLCKQAEHMRNRDKRIAQMREYRKSRRSHVAD
jgi:HNH endonuclease